MTTLPPPAAAPPPPPPPPSGTPPTPAAERVKVVITTHGVTVEVEAAAQLADVERIANRLHVDAVRRAPARSRPLGFDQ